MSIYARVAGTACAATLAALLCAAPAGADAPFQRGFVLTGWNAASYLNPKTDRSLQRMANDGSTNAAVFTQWFMDSPMSSHLAPDAERTPTDESLVRTIETARADGLSVTVKPQIGIRTGSWIGAAHPADLDAFWADYRTMLLHYADLAQEAGASMLVVGTEMGTLSPDEARWRALIAEVRTHFSGSLTYAANYDEFDRVPFWDALDYIGIDAYFGLADDSDPAPPVDSLVSAWNDRGYLDRIAAVSARTGRKVLFTEIGYRGTRATAVHPNIWSGTQVTDTVAQANAYEAFYRAVSGQPWMAGLYWWEINNDSWWVQDYSPVAKPAELVMADWNKRLAPPPSDTTPPPSDTTPPPSDTTPPPSDTTPPPTTDTPPPPPPTPDTPTPEPPVQEIVTTVDTTATAVVTEVAPQKAANPTPAPPVPATAAPVAHPAPRPAIYMTLRGKRLAGAVAPYSKACKGHIQLRVRTRRGGTWRYTDSPAPLSLTPAGSFFRRMPAGQLRVKALYTGSCGTAGSSWVTSSG
jgi:hypothetical protein